MKKQVKKRKSKNQLEPGDYLDIEQVRFILELLKGAAADGKCRTAMRLFIFQLLLNTGMRRGEAVSLDIRDMPEFHGKGQVVVRWEVAKGRRNRGIIVSEEFKKVLSAYIKRFCDISKPRSPLLLNEYGNRMTGHNIWCRMQTIKRHTGINVLRPHMMRHTYLSLLYGVSKDQMFVKDQGGHVKMDTTNIYVHILNSERKRQVDRLGHLAT